MHTTAKMKEVYIESDSLSTSCNLGLVVIQDAILRGNSEIYASNNIIDRSDPKPLLLLH